MEMRFDSSSQCCRLLISRDGWSSLMCSPRKLLAPCTICTVFGLNNSEIEKRQKLYPSHIVFLALLEMQQENPRWKVALASCSCLFCGFRLLDCCVALSSRSGERSCCARLILFAVIFFYHENMLQREASRVKVFPFFASSRRLQSVMTETVRSELQLKEARNMNLRRTFFCWFCS